MRFVLIILALSGIGSLLIRDIAVPLLSGLHQEAYRFDSNAQKITDSAAKGYSNLNWSPDGNYLAFVVQDDILGASLWLYNRIDNSLTLVEGEVPTP